MAAAARGLAQTRVIFSSWSLKQALNFLQDFQYVVFCSVRVIIKWGKGKVLEGDECIALGKKEKVQKLQNHHYRRDMLL